MEEKVPKYNFPEAKWDKFQECARSLIGEVDSDDSVDNWNAAISFMSHKAAWCSIPVKQTSRPRMLVPWWNKECDEAVRNRNVAYRRFKKYPVMINVRDYKRLRAVARRVIKGAKRCSWREFCGTLGPETPVRQLSSAVCKMSGAYKRPIPVLRKGDIVAVSNKERTDMFVESFQVVHSSAPNPGS